MEAEKSQGLSSACIIIHWVRKPENKEAHKSQSKGRREIILVSEPNCLIVLEFFPRKSSQCLSFCLINPLRKSFQPYLQTILRQHATSSPCSSDNCIAFYSNTFYIQVKLPYFSAQNPPMASTCAQWERGFLCPRYSYDFFMFNSPLLSVYLYVYSSLESPRHEQHEGRDLFIFMFLLPLWPSVPRTAPGREHMVKSPCIFAQ